MESIVKLKLSSDQKKILDSVMPGGEKWHAFAKADGGGCLKCCPYRSMCHEAGPNKVCSELWKSAELTPDVLDVLLHVVNNFEHYNRGDIEVKNSSKMLSDILFTLSQAQVSQLEGYIEEGNPRMRMHLYRERNSAVAKQFKRDALNQGSLVCKACDTDFLKKYSEEVATRVVECHHSIPLSSSEHKGKTQKSDLWLLCANCHRLAHSTPESLPLNELRKLVGSGK